MIIQTTSPSKLAPLNAALSKCFVVVGRIEVVK